MGVGVGAGVGLEGGVGLATGGVTGGVGVGALVELPPQDTRNTAHEKTTTRRMRRGMGGPCGNGYLQRDEERRQ